MLLQKALFHSGWVVDPEMFVFVYWRSWWFLALFNTLSRKCLWRLISYPNEMKGSKNLLRLLCFSREWGLWPWSHLYHLLKCPLSDGLYWNASALFSKGTKSMKFPNIYESETEGKGAGHNLWKNDIARGHNINWFKPNGSKMLDKSTWLDLDPQYTLIITYQQAKWHSQRHHDSSKVDHQRPKIGWWPNPWESPPLPQNSWNNPPTS